MDRNLRRLLIGGIVLFAFCSSSTVLSQSFEQTPRFIYDNQNFELEFFVYENEVDRPSSFFVTGFDIVISYEADLCCIGVSPPRYFPFIQPVPGLPAGSYDVYFLGQGVLTPDYVISENTSPQGSVTIHRDTPSLQMGLGSPKSDEIVGGFGMIRGWACYDRAFPPATIGKVSYQVDNGKINSVPYGSSRGDVLGRCGRLSSTAGFAVPINWNRFSLGAHTFTLYVDGQQAISHDVVVSGTGETFLRGLEAEYDLDNFPSEGDTTKVRWSQSAQDFTIVDVERDSP